MTVTFKPYRSRRASESIAEEIKQAILDGHMKNGDRLPTERHLADQFQVGRLTVREALRSLESNGLVIVRQGGGGGIYVGQSDPELVPSIIMDNLMLEGLTSPQITEARIAVECNTVKGAIERATDRDLECLHENVRRSEQYKPPEDGAEAFADMINFHVLIAEASHNPIFTLFVRSLMNWGQRRRAHWTPSKAQQEYSYRAHMEIFEAVRARKAAKAQRLITEHVLYMENINENLM